MRDGQDVQQPAVLKKANPWRRLILYLSITAVAVLTYLPAINNSFISDDFSIFSYLEIFRQSPFAILEAPSELFRLTSYLYFSLCLRLFGTNSEAFYWAGISLHVAVSLSVYVLVFMVTGKRVAAWAAAVFFAGYERHQEAIMWISASNSTIVTLSCVVFLILWLRSTTWSRRLALIVLPVALFSKEPAVTLAPLSVMLSVMMGKSWRAALREALPVLAITAGYIALWLLYSGRNGFVTQHYYAVGLHFFPVYARALFRMTSVALPFVVAILVVRSPFTFAVLRQNRKGFWFFAALMALPLIPVSFLTYQSSIPSRATYYGSVGLAAIVGMLFFVWHRELSSRRAGNVAVIALSAIVAGNITYVWMRKDSQYTERAAATRQLVHNLNGLSSRLGSDKSVCIENFPLDPSVGSQAARWFSSVPPQNVVFSNPCEFDPHEAVLRWDDVQGLTHLRSAESSVPENSPAF
jgi:hypothetical protein